MCGITCAVTLSTDRESNAINRAEEIQGELDASLNKIVHRGPDARGTWINEEGTVGLGHCRLAINDLRPSAAQPLHSSCGKIHAIVNGEIYDFDRLRAELAESFGYTFRTTSDSEVALVLYQRYGLDFLQHLRGEFAVCIYDERSRRFVAARDRYGIKPLYWTVCNGQLLVAAEAKAFLGFQWKAEWDVASIAQGGWNFDDRTLFKGVKKVLPGQCLIQERDEPLRFETYWDLTYPDKRQPEPRSVEEMVTRVRQLLLESVRLRLRADVPVGVYLSGGIDSSVIAGMLTHLVRERGEKLESVDGSGRVCCFGIAFDQASGYDESEIAERTAEWLDVKFVKKYMDEASTAANFEEAVYHCEHHSFDLNFVGKFALSELTRASGYKVILTGEGSDEHFAGYPTYVPDFLREPDTSFASPFLPEDIRTSLLSQSSAQLRAQMASLRAESTRLSPSAAPTEIANLHTVTSMAAFNFAVYAPWVGEESGFDSSMTIAAAIPPHIREQMRERWHPLHAALYVWTRGHLANQFLACLGDRAEMAHGVEARTPFLDHVLGEYVNSLPPSVKLRYDPDGGELVEKWILREAARPFVRHELYRRKKHAYTAPPTWPRGGPLHGLFGRLLTESNVKGLGFVDWERVRDVVEEGFGRGDVRAMRVCYMVGEWVVLAQRFGMAPAGPAPG